MKKKRGDKFIFWTPRILAILFLLFLAMFSLDVFGNGYTFWQTVLGLFMHNIPVFILLAALIISWKKNEVVGGIAFILFGIWYMARLAISMFMNPPFQWYFLSWSLLVAGPAFLVGILFLIGWCRNKKRKKNKTRI
jgi:hypothetical protein